MSFYEAFRDAMNMAQKADNIELYRQLLDLSAQALDLQAEIARLREENDELRKTKDMETDIEYYVDSFVTRKTDTKPIRYCAACWVDKKKLVPIQSLKNGKYSCPLCNAKITDMEKWKPSSQVRML